MGACTDGAPELRSGFAARIKQRSPNAVGTRCVIHSEALVSSTSPATMNGKPAIANRVVNFVKTSSIKSRLFNVQCMDMDADHEALVLYGCSMVTKRQHACSGLRVEQGSGVLTGKKFLLC